MFRDRTENSRILRPSYRQILTKYLGFQKRLVGLLATLLMAAIAMQLISPQIVRQFIDEALAGGELTLLAVVFMLVTVSARVLTVLTVYTSEKVAWEATNALRHDLVEHCLRLDIEFHEENSPGVLIERIDGDAAKLASFFSSLVLRILGNVLLLSGVLIAMFVEDWRIGFLMTVYAALTISVMWFFRSLAVSHWKEARSAATMLFGFIEERMAGASEVRAVGGLRQTVRQLQEHTQLRMKSELRASIMNVRLRVCNTGSYVLGQVLAVGMGYYLYNQDAITVGTIFLIVNYADLLFWPLREINYQVEGLQQAGGSVERILELHHRQGRVSSGVKRFGWGGPMEVSFEKVSFSYNQKNTVLDDVSFSLARGRVLSVLGRTGSGKSTLAKLISRQIHPMRGNITIDHMAIGEISECDFRRYVGSTPQSVQLFRGTVRDNLTFFEGKIPDHSLLRVVDALGLGEWFDTLPMGLDTQIKASGEGFSAGEGQLIALMRIFLRDPGLVVLDEVSSRLDPVTKTHVERAVSELVKGRTTVLVTHDPETVNRSDDVLILENGRIREYGKRQRLFQNIESYLASVPIQR